jgi:multicomponent Na+:H+ antiporter subunit D
MVAVLPILGALASRWPAGNGRTCAKASRSTPPSLLFACVVQLLDPVLAGERPELQLLELLPGLPIAFRVEPLGMIFALIASGLWIVNSVYSIGYMRGNQEKNQTRFYVCFALAIAAALAIAFSANLLTLFLFYEVLTLITYPLVTHAGTDKARAGGRTYLALLMGTSVLFLLPAVIYVWHLTGTTDFRAGGILPAAMDKGEGGDPAGAVHVRHRQGGADALPPLAAGRDGGADAGVGPAARGGRGQGRRVHGGQGGRLCLRPRRLAGATDWLVAISGFTIIAASVVALYADNLKRRLAYSTVSQLSYVDPRRRHSRAAVGGRRRAAHRRACLRQDHPVLRRRRDLHRRAQDRGQPARRHRSAHAVDHGGLSHRRAVDDRPAAIRRRFRQQVVHGLRRHGAGALVCAGRRSCSARCSTPATFLPIVYRAFFRPFSAEAAAHPHGEAPLPMVRRCASPRPARCAVLLPRRAARAGATTGDDVMKREHWLDDPMNVKMLWRGFLVVLALTVVAGFLRRPASTFRDREMVRVQRRLRLRHLPADDRRRQGAGRCCSSAATATTRG